MIGWSWCLQVDGGRVSCFVTVDDAPSLDVAVHRANEKLIEGQNLLDYDSTGVGIYVDAFTVEDLFQITCAVCGIQVNRTDQETAQSMVEWMTANCDQWWHGDDEDEGS